MKTINIILSVSIILIALTTAGCTNTAQGIHADWQQGTQKIADDINK